jgi:predicted DNA-binding helix-hairpin-helix protein
VEVNRASQAALLRVPGIGPQGAAAIVQARRSARLRSLEDLQRLGVRGRQAAPYILFDGRAPDHQLRLFTV